MISRTTGIAAAFVLTFVTACTTDAASGDEKPSIKEAELAFVKMFSDSQGKAQFTCGPGGSRFDYICQGKYVPVDRAGRVIEHRIGANLSHYFEGQPVFAISVIRDGAPK